MFTTEVLGASTGMGLTKLFEKLRIKEYFNLILTEYTSITRHQFDYNTSNMPSKHIFDKFNMSRINIQILVVNDFRKERQVAT